MSEFTQVAENVKSIEEAEAAVAFLRKHNIDCVYDFVPETDSDRLFPNMYYPYNIKVREGEWLHAACLFEQNAHIINVITGETVQERGW
jgi:hypothetical protein